MRLLSIDPSLRGTGFAILEEVGTAVRCREYGVINNPPKRNIPDSLLVIYDRLQVAILEHQPEVVVLESIIYVQSYATAIVLGAARGVVLLLAAQKGLPIHEYPPRRVKQAVVGFGGAEKKQVAFMVKALLGLNEIPPSDAADAIAIGLTHLHNFSTPLPKKRNSNKRSSWKNFIETKTDIKI
ncbi:MAG: crossover junction endodeoxyribonuclease RuvC [Chthoniobacterales bacterium]|nr:crossover junction endodeoxyribonuclease RuvC [Chthoniobacterales bacterium]